jgi:hypothetical protein
MGTVWRWMKKTKKTMMSEMNSGGALTYTAAFYYCEYK